MLQTAQRPCLKNISFRWCKLFKDLTWNICSSDVANWSKNLLEKCILLMLQTVWRSMLEECTSSDVANCSKHLRLKNVFCWCWCYKLILQMLEKSLTVEICSKTLLGKRVHADVANWTKTCLKNIFFWCCKLFKVTWNISSSYLKNVYFCWCCKLFKDITWKVYSVDVTNCSKTITWKMYYSDVANCSKTYAWNMFSDVAQRTYLKSVFCWCYKKALLGKYYVCCYLWCCKYVFKDWS